MLFEYLKEKYEDGEPIFVEDIHIEGINRPNLCQQLKTLADNGRIIRYEKGIYYIPKQSRFKAMTGPGPETVAEYKYISREGRVNGYYSGGTFANMIGISLQVPMKKEIVSNHVAAIVKEVKIGKQSFIVRRSYVPISSENGAVLQLLDILKNLDSYLDVDYDEARERIKNYAHKNQITRGKIDRYIRKFPDATFRYFYEMRLDHVLT